MKNSIITLLGIIALGVSACQTESNPIPDGSFRVTIVKIAEHDDLSATSLRLEFMGKQTISVSRKGGGASSSGSITVDPPMHGDSRGIGVVDVPIVATLTKVPGSTNMLKWLIGLSERKGNSLGTRSGSPWSLPVEAEKIADTLEISISEGFHPLGQDITIGTFQGQPIVLSMK
jgi:hypothetical protein